MSAADPAKQSSSVASGLLAALFPLINSACCLAFALQWPDPESVDANLVITLLFAQPIICIALLVYSQSLQIETGRWHRLAFFCIGGLVVAAVVLIIHPGLLSLLLDPGVGLVVLWNVLGLVVNLLLMREGERERIAKQTGAQAQDGFELLGLVPMCALIVLIPVVPLWVWWQPAVEPELRWIALLPALYFLAYAACVWRTYTRAFAQNPQAWVQTPVGLKLHRLIGGSRERTDN